MLRRIEVLLDEAESPVFCFDRNKYYIGALSESGNVPLAFSPLSANFFAAIRQLKGAHNLWGKWSKFTRTNRYDLTSNHIGRYKFVYENATVRVVIDTSDGRNLHDESALAWSDLYFKCNAWPSIQYPKKVVNMLNGNGTLTVQKVNTLKSYRQYKKEYDLVYWSRIWAAPGGKPDNSGVEHNIRIFEALAKADGKNNLLAVFPNNMNCDSLSSYRDRLDVAGVPWQNGWGDINSTALWNNLANARVNFLRPGNHLCVSWRMMDLLCIGACVMLDSQPYTRWPEPLRQGVNYIDADCAMQPDYSLPDKQEYERITERVSQLINNPELIEKISKNNIDYFDKHASFDAVTDYILRTIAERFPESQTALQLSGS